MKAKDIPNLDAFPTSRVVVRAPDALVIAAFGLSSLCPRVTVAFSRAFCYGSEMSFDPDFEQMKADRARSARVVAWILFSLFSIAALGVCGSLFYP